MADPLNRLSKDEMVVFVSIVHKLHSRKHKSMLLGDLGSQLSHPHRQIIREQGRLRAWLSQFPIFSLTGKSYAERVTLNIGDSARRWDQGDNTEVLKLSGTNVDSVSEGDVVEAEHMLDTLLLHLLEVIEEMRSLRHRVDALNGGCQRGTKRKSAQPILTYRHVI